MGQVFIIQNNQPLENKEANGRMIHTTPAKEVIYDERSETYTFKTANSTYQFKVLGVIDVNA